MQRAQCLVSGTLFAAAVLASVPAAGLSSQQIDGCSNRGSAPVSQKITGCTAMIESRRYKGKELAKVFHNRGAFYSDQGDIERAIADFDQAIRLNEKFAAGYYSRGLAYKGKGDLDSAFVDFDQAFRLDPTDTNARKNRALVYDSDENLDRALARFDEEVKQHPLPLSINPYFQRGLVHYARREYDRAIEDFGMVLQWAPEYGPAFWNQTRAYCAGGGNYWIYQADLMKAMLLDPKYVNDHPLIEECPL